MQQEDTPIKRLHRTPLRVAMFVMAYVAAAGAIYGGKHAVDWFSMMPVERQLAQKAPEFLEKAKELDREMGLQRTDKMKVAGTRLYEAAPEEVYAWLSARQSLPTENLARLQMWTVRLQAVAPDEFKQLLAADTENKAEAALAELHKAAPVEADGWWDVFQNLYGEHSDEMDAYLLAEERLYEAAPKEMDAFAEAEAEAILQGAFSTQRETP